MNSELVKPFSLQNAQDHGQTKKGNPKFTDKIAIYDPGFSDYGHHQYFNKHVIALLSELYSEVLFYDTHGVEYNDLPKNAEIKRLSKKNLKLQKKDQAQFYKLLWSTITDDGCSMIFLTSQGQGSDVALYKNLPSLPFTIIVHIVWQFIVKGSSVEGFNVAFRKARCLFVLDDYLVPRLLTKNKNVKTFPYYSYPDNYKIPDSNYSLGTSVKRRLASLMSSILPRKPLPELANSDNEPLVLGTIGVINERRNVDFLLETLTRYKGKIITYYLYGKPIGQEGERIVGLSRSLKFPNNVNFKSKFRYLSNKEYNKISGKCDFIVLAYDKSREEQVPGVLYEFAKNNTSLIVPRIEPFISIEKRFPNLFMYYENLSEKSLNELLGKLSEKGGYYRTVKQKSSDALQRFIDSNNISTHIDYLRILMGELNPRKQVKKSRVSSTGNNQEKLDILYYPVFEDINELNDQVARACWYLDCIDFNKIIFTIRLKSTYKFELPDSLDEAIQTIYDRVSGKCHFVCYESDEQLKDIFTDTDIIMQWKMETHPSAYYKKEFNRLKKDKQVWRVDKYKIRFEGSHYIKAVLHNFKNIKNTLQSNSEKIKRLVADCKKTKSYIFCTGPSVENYREFKYADGVSIICNSIILDKEMMDYIKPRILVFGDPIFHFGPSRYASKFRKELARTIVKYDLYIVIPFNYYPIFINYFPEFEARTIGIPFDYDAPVNLDLEKHFYINPYKNILTMLMLPLGTTLSRQINILGVDGRKKTNDSYFWKHNPSTQINDEMENIKEVHPGFFTIDYNDYYEEHLADLEDMLYEIEQKNVKVKILTPSYVPFLRKKYRLLNKPYEKEFYPLVSVIIVVNYFNSDLLYNTIKTILEQSYNCSEIILTITDRSFTKEIEMMVSQFDDNRIKTHEIVDGNINNARCDAVKYSHGDYIAILNPGDQYLPGSLIHRMNYLISEGSQGVFSQTKIYKESKNNLSGNIGSNVNTVTPNNISPNNVHLSSLICQRHILLDNELWEDNIESENDFDLLTGIVNKCKVIHKTFGNTMSIDKQSG